MIVRRGYRIGALVAMLCLLPPAATLAQAGLPATLGASTPEFQDDVAEPGLWGLPDGHGSTTDAHGAIEMTFTDEGWMWGWRDLAAAHHPVVRVEGSLAIDGDGVAGGWMCGASDGLFAFGVVDRAGRWRIGHIVEGEVTVDRDGVAGAPGGVARVGVECGQENVDVTRLLLRVDGVSVGSANVGPLGPFDRVALVGTSDTGDGSVTFDDIAAWTGRRYAPSDDPPSTPGPRATPPVVDSILGADTPAFEDDFATEGSWGTGVSPQGVVSYADEQLVITLLAANASRWSWRSIDEPMPVLRIEGTVAVNGEGSAGWMCGDASDEPAFLFGVMGASGGWTVGQVVAGDIAVLEQGTVPGGPPGDVPRHVVLECGDTSDAGSRVLLWVDGDQVADVPIDDPRGPYQKAAAVACSAASMSMVFSARFDDVVVRTGARDAPSR